MITSWTQPTMMQVSACYSCYISCLLSSINPIPFVKKSVNLETDVGVMEGAEEQSGDAKYISDRCKVLVESKVMIDKFPLDECLIGSIDSLQICGLEIYFVNISLTVPGTQFYRGSIGNSLSDIIHYLDLAIHLLCLRNQYVSVMNQYEDYLSNSRSRNSSAKRSYGQLPKEDFVVKQECVRGLWKSPRTSKTPPPLKPDDSFFFFFGND
ncbi:unnamed protein product [Rhizopus stolonifer]